jgi:hypothetical protein
VVIRRRAQDTCETDFNSQLEGALPDAANLRVRRCGHRQVKHPATTGRSLVKHSATTDVKKTTKTLKVFGAVGAVHRVLK